MAAKLNSSYTLPLPGSVIFASFHTKSTYFNSQHTLLTPQTQEIILWPSSPIRHMESIRSIQFTVQEIQSPLLQGDQRPADNLTETCQYVSLRSK